jgi:hypothetical protein
LARLELRLQANALPPDFVDWVVASVAADKSSKNPVGLLKKALLDYDERIDEYRKTIAKKQASKKPKKALPPDKCPECKGKIISTQFEAGCRKCGLVFEYDADFDVWTKKAAKLAQYQDSA